MRSRARRQFFTERIIKATFPVGTIDKSLRQTGLKKLANK